MRRKLNNAGLTLEQYLEADDKRTTAASVENGGWYLYLAKSLVSEPIEKAAADRGRLLDALLRRKETWNATACEHGCKEGRMDGGGYCSCKVGQLARDLDSLHAYRTVA